MQTPRPINLPYGKHWLDEKDIKSVLSVLRGDLITQGPKIEQFEKSVAKFVSAKYAVSFNSGTSALLAACFAAGIKAGDEVITTPYTFCASSNCFVWFGGKPVFVDIDENTLNIDHTRIEAAITKRTKAILIVDFAGLVCDLEYINNLAKEYKLLVIEDASHAIGSKYKGKKTGAFSDITCFSFHPVKTVATGEGGMVTTNNLDFFKKMKMFRNSGITKEVGKKLTTIGPWYYEMQELGLSLRLTDIQAALGLSQLKKINMFVKRRREIVNIYNESFANLPITFTHEPLYAESAWHLYTIRVDLRRIKGNRLEIFERLRKTGLGVQVHYIPVHMQPYYMNKFGYKRGDFPVSERVYDCEITLPLFPKMTEGEVEYVISTFTKIISQNII